MEPIPAGGGDQIQTFLFITHRPVCSSHVYISLIGTQPHRYWKSRSAQNRHVRVRRREMMDLAVLLGEAWLFGSRRFISAPSFTEAGVRFFFKAPPLHTSPSAGTLHPSLANCGLKFAGSAALISPDARGDILWPIQTVSVSVHWSASRRGGRGWTWNGVISLPAVYLSQRRLSAKRKKRKKENPPGAAGRV